MPERNWSEFTIRGDVPEFKHLPAGKPTVNLTKKEGEDGLHWVGPTLGIDLTDARIQELCASKLLVKTK